MAGQFRIEALALEQDRAAFPCGSAPLDMYLREQASQDMRRRNSAWYVAVDEATNAIAGYYTLAAAACGPSNRAGFQERRRFCSLPACWRRTRIGKPHSAACA